MGREGVLRGSAVKHEENIIHTNKLGELEVPITRRLTPI